MFSAQKKIRIVSFLNSRLIHKLVYFLQSLPSYIYFTGERTVNAKSILGLLSLNIKNGSNIKITVCSKTSQNQAETDLANIEMWLGTNEIKITNTKN
jgi:phosphotransferase system HPr-like phosphotransfer protein